jgi:hypothetical protein
MSNRLIAQIKPIFIRLEYSHEKQTIKACYGGQRYETKGIELFNVNVPYAGFFTAGDVTPTAVCAAGLAKHVKDLYMVKVFFQEIQSRGVRCGSSDISACGGVCGIRWKLACSACPGVKRRGQAGAENRSSSHLSP